MSIIETFDFRDDKPETVRAIGNTRKKLYFNPAYFEPHLLMVSFSNNFHEKKIKKNHTFYIFCFRHLHPRL